MLMKFKIVAEGLKNDAYSQIPMTLENTKAFFEAYKFFY